MAILAGKLAARRADCAPVAGKSDAEPTGAEPAGADALSQDQLTIRRPSRRCSWICSSRRTAARRRRQIVLDLDATDDPLQATRKARFFHGYYDYYCYLPLYIFCGRHLLAAKLRRSNIDGAAGAVEEVERIVGQIRATLASYADRAARRFRLLLARR